MGGSEATANDSKSGLPKIFVSWETVSVLRLTLILLSIEEVRTEFSVPTTRDLISTIRWKWAFKRFTSRPKKVDI